MKDGFFVFFLGSSGKNAAVLKKKRINGDHWGNVRLQYSDLDGNGSISSNTEILKERNFYPGGLFHRGYNNGTVGTENKHKTYQGQEWTDDLELNTHEWKYRISDPAIIRFWQIDPLSEDYPYNSTYAFQENKFGMGSELEGLELAEAMFYQEVKYRAKSIWNGFGKMFTGTRNEMISQATEGSTPPSDTNTNNIDNNGDNDGPNFSENIQLVMEGAAQVEEAVPDARDVANTMEVVGDGMVVASPATGPAAPVVAVGGEVMSTSGTAMNIGLDISEGDYKSAAKRVVIEAISGGLSSIARDAPGVNETAEQIIDTHILFYENVVVPSIEEKSEWDSDL